MELMTTTMQAEQFANTITVLTTIGGIVVTAAIVAVDIWITVLIIKALKKYITGK